MDCYSFPKNSLKILLFSLFAFVVTSYSFAQKKVGKKKLYKQVKQLMEFQNFRDALPKAKALYRLDSLNSEYNYLLGVCYLKSAGEKKKAVPYFEAVLNSKDTIPLTFYYMGKAYHSAYRFDEAIEYYRKYKSTIKPTLENFQDRENVERKIEMCNNGKKLVEKPVKVPIRNMGNTINSFGVEYSPVISADESVLMLTSRRPGGVNDKRDMDGLYFEDVFITKNNDNKWSYLTRIDTVPSYLQGEKLPKSFTDSMINSSTHESAVGLSADGQKLLLYKSIKSTGGDIYISYLKGTKWSPPVRLPEPLNSKYWEGSASFSADENSFFFSSDRPGGFGGKDIYKITKLPDGKYAAPVNLGTAVNTPYDEDAPFIHPDGKTLYFSSTGHTSMGGYDMFRSKYIEGYSSVSERYDEQGKTTTDTTTVGGSWSMAENIGYPLNTPEDDIYLVISADGQRGYFSSDREGTFGDQDIFTAEMPDDMEADAVLTLMKGYISANGNAVEAKITVTDNATGEIQGVYNSNAATGQYVLVIPAGKNYNLSIESPGYLFSTDNVYFSNQDTFMQITKNIDLLSGELGDKIVLKNVFYSAKSNNILPVSKVELNKVYEFLQKNPLLKVALNAYVDTKVLDWEVAYARAVTMQDYLVERGVNFERIIANGFALDDDTRTNDLKDKIELQLMGGHLEETSVKRFEKRNSLADTVFFRLLRDYGAKSYRNISYRVQIGAFKSSVTPNFESLKKKDWLYYLKISKEISPEGYTKYMVGNFRRMLEAEDLRNQIVKEGFMDAWVVGYFRGRRITIDELRNKLKTLPVIAEPDKEKDKIMPLINDPDKED